MSQSELLKKVVDVLNSMNIEYMLTGSIVSSLQGEPRATHDVDLVIVIRDSDISRFVQSFASPQLVIDQDMIGEAIRHHSMFNLMDLNSGDKVDFWMLTDEPFDRSRFSRRFTQNFLGFDLIISRPEDTILAKLRWAKLSGGSEKQFIDALRVYEVQYHLLDRDYLDDWIQRLDLMELWERLRKEAIIVT